MVQFGNLIVIVPRSVQLGVDIRIYSLSEKGLNDVPHTEKVKESDSIDGDATYRVAVFYNLPPGKYRVMKPGYEQAPGDKQVLVNAGETAKVSFSEDEV